MLNPIECGMIGCMYPGKIILVSFQYPTKIKHSQIIAWDLLESMSLRVISDLSGLPSNLFLGRILFSIPYSDEQILIKIEWSMHIILDFLKFLASVKAKNNMNHSIRNVFYCHFHILLVIKKKSWLSSVTLVLN